MPFQPMQKTKGIPIRNPSRKHTSVWIGFFFSMLIGIAVLVQQANPARTQPTDPPCIHGMRIVGKQAIYLSHMGLFNVQCHSYQGLFEVTFEGPNNPQQIYLSAQRKEAQQNEFTIEPTEMFILPNFVAEDQTSFRGNIHRGQYERPETNPQLLARNVTVRLKRVLFFVHFNQEPSNLPARNTCSLVLGQNSWPHM